MKAFPVIRDLVTDVSWNYRVNEQITPFTPRDDLKEGVDLRNGDFLIDQVDTDRMSEFRKCIECFMCQDVCHILRDHRMHNRYYGPRFMIRMASLDMHPLDGVDRLDQIADEAGIGLCNITKCCTEVCPEGIHITDNAIIPMKERVVDQRHDPILKILGRTPNKGRKKPPPRTSDPTLSQVAGPAVLWPGGWVPITPSQSPRDRSTVGSLHRPPGRCTSAACARRWWPG